MSAETHNLDKPPVEDIYGTLPDWVIRHYIKIGVIGIDPLASDWEHRIGPVTIDFHMGNEVLVPQRGEDYFIDVAQGVDDSHYERKTLRQGQMHLLVAGQFIIVPTEEKLTLPLDFIGRLEGRSSLARVGLVVHLTAGRFDPGWNNRPVLELKNNSHVPIAIYQGFPICAFSFERLMAPVESAYKDVGRYNDNVIRSKLRPSDMGT